MLWFGFVPLIMFFTFHGMYNDPVLGGGHEPRMFIEWCFFIFSGCFLSALISLVPIGIAIYIGSLPELVGTKDQEYPLIALREKDGFSGQGYFLGAGFIGDKQYYFWYRRDPKGYISGGKTVREPHVDIYETEGIPKMVTSKTAYANEHIKKWYWLIGLDLRDPDWCDRFYIPKGSIKEGFTL